MTAVAVDLGGTRLKARRVSSDESASGDVFTFEHGGAWRDGLAKVRAHFGDIDEMGLCVPGIVEERRVVALPGKLPGIEGVDLGRELDLPLLVVNDAIAYGIGESVHGAGRGHERAVVVTIGTGVGVAVIEGGAPLGKGPLGGGILGGQIPLPGEAGEAVDTSDRLGTFEARCRADTLLASVPGAADLPDVYARLHAAEPEVQRGFRQFRAGLTDGLLALALAHSPSVMVVGGGAAQPGLIDGVEEALAPRLWSGQQVAVRLAELGDGAALSGLAVLLSNRGRP